MTDWEERARAGVEAWHRSVYEIADAQAQLLLAALKEGTQTRPQAFVRQWTDAQRELLQSWLALAGGEQTGTQMVQALQDAAEHLVRSQADWAHAWTAAQEDLRRRGRSQV